MFAVDGVLNVVLFLVSVVVYRHEKWYTHLSRQREVKLTCTLVYDTVRACSLPVRCPWAMDGRHFRSHPAPASTARPLSSKTW